MRIPGLKTVKTFSRWIQARIFGGVMILGYHRVTNSTRDEYGVCVSPENFSDQMEGLRQSANPISLSNLVQHLRDGFLPPKSVAVTFDDGYADILYQAKPVLERFEIPATVFLCSGWLAKEFWWDELEWLIMHSRANINELHLRVGKDRFLWDTLQLDGEAETLQGRRILLQALYNFLLHLNFVNLLEAMNTIRSWAGISRAEKPVSRAMNHAEITQLLDGGLIEVGSHTRNHLMLPRLSPEQQMEEIVSGKNDLEILLGKKIEGFSYPNGWATPDAKRIVQDAGFRFACTSLQNVVKPGGDLFEMTRFWQKNVGGDKFLQGLNLWMNM